jgi:Ca2+-binding EF-hand superfamily protein
MSERIYRLILALYPSRFRDEFGDGALALFRDRLRAERGFAQRLQLWIDMIRDAAVSLPVEYRRAPLHLAGSHAGHGAGEATFRHGPEFHQFDPEIPRRSALINGGIVTIVVFTGLALFMGSAAKRAPWLLGSHHPSRSHILPARTDAIAKTDLDAEVKLKPMPFEPPISPYFRLILVLGALDTDRDNVISAAEIDDAPTALRLLDKNHDGKLSAEECGQRFGTSVASMDPTFLRNARLEFMRFHPVLAALDSNHDGEISASEIRNAARALRTLDLNHDGKLTENELLPLVNPAGPAGADHAGRTSQ